MSADRMRRVNEAIRQVIGDAVSCDLKDPRVGFVTVTDVRTSADLSHARVYVSVLGGSSTREETLEGLSHAHGYLQRRIAGELHLKRTPTLEFSYDDTTDRAMRLDALIDSELEGHDAAEAHGEGDTLGGDSSREGSRA
ncbi:MAG TPA: 30S ribosome-binding factor RbfA [Solirubrobacteraceae bacterium]|jgi:ribosome-binding factor A